MRVLELRPLPEHVGTQHGLVRLARTQLHLQCACPLFGHLMRGTGRLQLGGVPSTLAHRLHLLTTTRLLELLGERLQRGAVRPLLALALHLLTTTRLLELLGERLQRGAVRPLLALALHLLMTTLLAVRLACGEPAVTQPGNLVL